MLFFWWSETAIGEGLFPIQKRTAVQCGEELSPGRDPDSGLLPNFQAAPAAHPARMSRRPVLPTRSRAQDPKKSPPDRFDYWPKGGPVGHAEPGAAAARARFWPTVRR